MVNVPNSDWLRIRARERRHDGWEISDVVIPAEMEALADQLDRLEVSRLKCEALMRENDDLREKLAAVHRLACEASSHLLKTCRGMDSDVDKAASTIALAIRVGA